MHAALSNEKEEKYFDRTFLARRSLVRGVRDSDMSSVDARSPQEEGGSGENPLLVSRNLARSHVGRIRKDTEVALSLSPREAHGAQRLGRSIGDGGPLHSVTLELSVEGHTACVYTTHKYIYIYMNTHTRVRASMCGARNSERGQVRKE